MPNARTLAFIGCRLLSLFIVYFIGVRLTDHVGFLKSYNCVESDLMRIGFQVNGCFAMQDGRRTETDSGRVLRRQ